LGGKITSILTSLDDVKGSGFYRLTAYGVVVTQPAIDVNKKLTRR